MVNSAIATAADYSDAILTARRAKNILFLLILLILLGELAIFFTVRYYIDPVNAPHPRTIDWLKYLVGIMAFIGLVSPIILGVDLLLLSAIMLVGRLIGVSRVVGAFLWCVVLEVLLFPWQAFLINQSFTSSDFKVPGVLYTWAELLSRARIHPDHIDNSMLFWARFVGFPVVAIVILLVIQIASGRGLRQALGENMPPDFQLSTAEPV